MSNPDIETKLVTHEATGVAVRLAVTSSTNDDDYNSVHLVDLNGDRPDLPLRVKRIIRNAAEAKFSEDGEVLAVTEIDGTILVWRRSGSGEFEQDGTTLYSGGAISKLQVSQDGSRIQAARMHREPVIWVFDGTSYKLNEA